MVETMIASGMSDGQIETAVEQLRAAMRKHRDEVEKDAAQQALGVDNLGMRMFSVFRGLAEAVSKMLVRQVTINHSRTPEEAIKATGRREYVNAAVVKAMPKGEGVDATVYFFKPSPDAYDENGLISDDAVEKEFEMRGLKLADPYSLAAVNEADPTFADEHPNSTHWKDTAGKWCFATFDRWDVERGVDVGQNGRDWGGRWWFAGVRK